MGVSYALRPGMHLLVVTPSATDRLDVAQALFRQSGNEERGLVAVTSERCLRLFEAVRDVSGAWRGHIDLFTVESVFAVGDPWDGFCEQVESAVSRAEARAEARGKAWPEEAADGKLVIFVDLDPVFERCSSAGDMMQVLKRLHLLTQTHRRTVIEAVSVSRLPRSLPDGFFEIHSDWTFEREQPAGLQDIQAGAERVVLDTPEFRSRFLGLARDDQEAALALVPDVLSDYRRGFLVLDRRHVIRDASARAARLLSQNPVELIGRPVSACVDGVDLVTLKRECARVAASTAGDTPFVVSWRMGPGKYEPREVTVDPITSDHQPLGYLVSISPVESVRGPRAVYRQIADEERSAPAGSDGDDPEVTREELISENLYGTQVTRREHEILLLILQGMSNLELARTLEIAEVTVKKHLTSIYRKLRITNRAELIRSFAEPLGSAGIRSGESE